MKRFRQYVVLREQGELDEPQAEPQGSGDSLVEIIKLAWERYRPETKHFIGQLSNKDPDIKRLEEKLDDSSAPNDGRMERERDDGTDDVVMPPEADTSPGLEADEGG
jgi:hypothetical protein